MGINRANSKFTILYLNEEKNQSKMGFIMSSEQVNWWIICKYFFGDLLCFSFWSTEQFILSVLVPRIPTTLKQLGYNCSLLCLQTGVNLSLAFPTQKPSLWLITQWQTSGSLTWGCLWKQRHAVLSQNPKETEVYSCNPRLKWFPTDCPSGSDQLGRASPYFWSSMHRLFCPNMYFFLFMKKVHKCFNI